MTPSDNETPLAFQPNETRPFFHAKVPFRDSDTTDATIFHLTQNDVIQAARILAANGITTWGCVNLTFFLQMLDDNEKKLELLKGQSK